jgi:hypothetical protein
MKSSLKWTLALIATLLALPFIVPNHPSPQNKVPMPWDIQLADGKSKVFGLMLPGSTLNDASQVFGKDMSIALIAAPNEPASVEAFFDNVTIGTISGKLVITLALSPAETDQIKTNSPHSEFMESATRKYTMIAADVNRALATPIKAITLSPSASLDEPTLVARFGNPDERIASGEKQSHLLYPEKGLAITVNSKGKDLLHYTAPADFAKLKDALSKAKHAESK